MYNNLTDYNFILPPHLIAQHPAIPKESAKLLCVSTNTLADYKIENVINLLNSGDLLIFNDTKVIKSKLIGKRNEAIIKINLHKNIDSKTWLAFAKNSGKLLIGDTIVFNENFKCTVLSKGNLGEVELFFDYNNLLDLLQQYGSMPIPPYIKRLVQESDNTNYQTIFAKNIGAVASPTSHLHFTEQLIHKLEKKGVKKAFVTLHVGAGTFLPVTSENIENHKMHSEYGFISSETANLINQTKANGKKVVAVGTTSLRTLEYASQETGHIKEFSGNIDLFIRPGFKFKVADNLITNFHLPKSTLFMLVCAFAGFNNMHSAYEHAIINNYRFFSYGDACFLHKHNEGN